MKTNVILHGDCRERLSDVPTESVNLIYMDPPFFSNKKYEEQMQDGSEEMRASFDDRWAGGVDKFIEWMRPALAECHRVLKETGSIYLHCDWHADSELDVLMKEIFGRENKRNAIAWCYKSPSGATKCLPRKHDTILFYGKSGESIFNMPRIPYGNWGAEDLNRTGEEDESRGTDKRWVRKKRIVKEGKKCEDFWTDIPFLSGGKERTGYPTQKPEKLLERIIKASSNEGDLILDPVMGSGTTLAVSAKLNRQFIGIDISERACKITKKRLGDIEVLEGQQVEIEFKNEPIEYLKAMFHDNFERWACERLGGRQLGKTRDRDGEMPDGTPIEVKTWKESKKIGRSVVQKLAGVANKSPTKKGILVGWDFTREAVMEVAEQRKAGIDIELKKVEDLRKQ